MIESVLRVCAGLLSHTQLQLASGHFFVLDLAGLINSSVVGRSFLFSL